jgi:hypothetical protein
MGKYKLNFSELNSNSDVECLEFTSAKKRSAFIADRVIGSIYNDPKKVFTLIVKYSDNDERDDVYVFDKWECIDLVVKQSWEEFWLFEWDSYEEAYKNALDLKEISPLCYSPERLNKIQ